MVYQKRLVGLVLVSSLLCERTCTTAFNHATPATQKNFAILQSTATPSHIERRGQTLELSNTSIHVGNINWNIAGANVLDYFEDVTTGLRVKTIEIKEATSKKRDKDKQHGGSAKLTFISHDDAKEGMARFETDFIEGDSSTVIGKIKIRWALIDEHAIQKAGYESELSEERILHRAQRAEKYARQRRIVAEKTDDIIKSLHIFTPKGTEMLVVPKLNWANDVPDAIDPMRGGGIRKGTERGIRKQAQVEAFLHVLKEALLCEDNGSSRNVSKIADLGSGAGNLSLPLAWFLRDLESIRVLAVDINVRALDRLSNRAKEINIEIDTLVEDLSKLSNLNDCDNDPLESCSAVVSLHACGAASDLAIETAVSRNLPFVISPCCIGKGKVLRKPNQMPAMSSQRSGAPEGISYPRSRFLQNMVQDKDYSLILSAADYSAGNMNGSVAAKEVEHQQRGKAAKTIVETDRLQWAEERGYFVKMVEIPRLGGLYPKRELLLGAKSGTLTASRISQLSTTQLQAKISDEDGYDEPREGSSLLENENSFEERMDLGGFAGYLAPYVFALILSVGVTAAFVKFVLLDY